jgi:hypothetical protein
MADYYTTLARKIREISDDPAKMREVVYETARLALRWQVQFEGPRLSITQSRCHINELEKAIARLEADTAGQGGPAKREPDEAEADFQQSQRPAAAVESEKNGPQMAEAFVPQPRDFTWAELVGLAAVARSLDGPGRCEPDRAVEMASWQSPNAPFEAEEDGAPGMAEEVHKQRRDPLPANRAELDAASAHVGDRGIRKPYKLAAHSAIEPVRGDVPDLAEEDHPRQQANLETDSAHAAGRGNPAPGKAAAHFKSSRQSRNAAIEPARNGAPDMTEEFDPQLWDDRTSAELEDHTGSRELILVPDRAGRAIYRANPVDFVNPDRTYVVSSAPRPRARIVVLGLKVAFQLAVAALAVTAFYVAMWGHRSPQTSGEILAVAAQASGPQPVAPPDGAAAVATASLAGGPIGVALPFPRPTVFGVYLIGGDNQLIELEQVQATPVDPRTRSQLQIVKPPHTVIAAAKPAFVIFRRDLVSNAPEKIPVRIASRIAHSMIFDSSGKPMVTTPATDTWLIRDQGYDLRVSPIRESPEMVLLRPQSPEFSFPSGRYELMLGGQAYDFAVAGDVTDPAHCVEGVATTRGPVFYECKSP